MSKLSPRFRKDLSAVAREQEDGGTSVELTDPETGQSFTLYEFEYALALQLDGQPYDDIIVWGVANYDTPLSEEALDEFAAKMRELGFLEQDITGAHTPPPISQPTQAGFSTTTQDAPGGLTLESLNLSAEAMTEISGKITSSSGVPKAISDRASGAVSRSFSERRQPPGPDSVEMGPFEDVSLRFRAPPPERKRNSTGAFLGVVALVAAVGGGGYFYWSQQHPKKPQSLRLRVVAPRPTAVYRWFATVGSVVDLESRSLAFDTAGKVVELMPAGTRFITGDVLGKLVGATALQEELKKHKEKMAAFEQLRDSLKAKPGGAKANLRDVEDKITARKKMVDDVQAALAKLVLRAPEAGTIVDTSAKVGLPVAAKVPALKWRGRNLHGDFTMDQEDYAKASKLEFCRVEVISLAGEGASPGGTSPPPPPTPPPSAKADGGPAEGASGSHEPRFIDCTIPPPGPTQPGIPSLLRKFIVTLPTDAGLVAGQQLRLARRRYDGVFPLPPSAVEVQTDVVGRVWVAAPNGTAEPRPVTIVEAKDEILVSDGVNSGDEIIAEPPHELSPGTLVEPVR